MALFDLIDILDATRGQVLVRGPVCSFTGISTDTRTLQPGNLFVALRGERFDGHQFLAKARAMGAAGALVEDPGPGVRRRTSSTGSWCVIEVTDTLYALGQLARHHRRRFFLPVVGITGSAGKTTTKEMTASILEQGQVVLKSQGNFNNEVGLPLTLFTLRESHQAAVLEFGMRGRGQISYLASLAQPTVGVVTNVGLTHLELLGSPQAIALAKAELLDEMPPEAIAVLPAQDAFFPLLREHAQGPVVTFGEDDACDYRASDLVLGADGCLCFTLHTPGDAVPVCLGTPGAHQVRNALAAAAAASCAGATTAQLQQGLTSYRAGKGRMQVLHAPRGYSVIDDSYNANPAAVRATLEFLARVPGARKVAILGDMRELGPTEGELHRELGRYAMELHLDALLAVGELGREYVRGAADERAQWFPDHAAAVQTALTLLAPGDVVLVKGSRAMQMEEIVAALVSSEQ